ncbi:MAG: ABC transporter permease [Alphaproteobacteria bacterium]|nr:MAG: ABC transporter permease [Alphaproteobacteria bacterium]
MSTRAPTDLPRLVDVGLIPALNLLTALVISGLVIWVLGEDPFEAMSLMVSGAFGYGEAISYTLYYTTNFIFTGLAVSFAYRCGLFNIGGEGQAVLGGIGILIAALLFKDLPGLLLIPLCIIFGAALGALWAAIPAWLLAKRGSHIVITTIMFNFIAAAFLSYLLVGPLRRAGAQSTESEDIVSAAQLMPLHDVFAFLGMAEGPANMAFVIALLLCLFYGVFMNRTKWGYELRVVGQNPAAARFGGISANRGIMIAMILSGAMAGLMGLNEVLGVQHRLVTNFTSGFGFVGIAVAFMGRHNPIGIILAALLFGALYQGGAEMAFEMPAITRDLVVMIQGLVILFAGALEHMYRPALNRIFANPKKIEAAR